jgi:MFS family permease
MPCSSVVRTLTRKAFFALAPFAGPAFGPIVAGYISVSGTVRPKNWSEIDKTDFQSWRWVFWVTTIFASVCLLVIIFLIPETYSPAILVAKAGRVRKETGDERYYAPLEKAERNLKSTLEGILLKPFVMLCKFFASV